MPNFPLVLDDHAYDLLRRGGALVHAVPGARLEITADDDVVLVVADPLATVEGATTCTPCGFRNALARALRLHGSGRRLALLGIDDGRRVGVRLDVGPSGDVLDGDLVVTRISDRIVALVASTLSPDAIAGTLADAGVDPAALSSHHDAELGVTILHLDLPLGDDAGSSVALDVLGAARDACAVAELVDDVARVGVQSTRPPQ
jgi:hypothetical protein